MENAIILPLIIAAMISFSLGAYVWQLKTGPEKHSFILFMAGILVWTVSYAFQFGSESLSVQYFWARMRYFGIVIVPPAWLLVSLGFTGQKKWLESRAPWLLVLEPIFILLLIWTNDSHHLFWQDYPSHLRPDPGITLRYGHGPAFTAHVIYSYTLLGWGTFVLLRFIRRSPRLYRVQGLALMVGASAPWAANILYITGTGPFPGIDLTPFTFAFTSPVLAWGMFYFRFLDLTPVTPEAILHNLRDGVFVLDNRYRVLAANPKAAEQVRLNPDQLIGTSAHDIFPSWRSLLERTSRRGETDSEVVLGEGEQARCYEVRISPLYNARKRRSGYMILSHDITARKATEQALREALAETEALYRVSRALMASESLTGMLQTVVFSIAEALQAEQVSLVTFDMEEQQITQLISAGKHPQPAEEITFNELMGGLTGWVTRMRRPALMMKGKTDPRESVEMQKRRLKTGGGSTLVAPMIYQDRVLGAITAANNSSQPDFTQKDVDLIMALANQAATVVENARLFQAERRQRRQAETLREVASILTASLDLKEVLPSILNQLARVIAYDSASVMLAGNDGTLSIVAHNGFHPDVPVTAPMEAGEYGHLAVLLETRKPLIISDTQCDPRWKQFTYSAYIRCWLGVPLIAHDRVIGLLNLDKCEVGFYTQADAELAQAFADQAAIAIENARLFESEQQRVQEAETLGQATAAILSTLNLQEAVERILVQLERVVPFDSASVQLLGDGYIEIVGGRGWDPSHRVLGRRLPIPGNNPNTIVVKERRPVLLGDARHAFPTFTESHNSRIRSWLGVPLIVHDTVTGMLAVDGYSLNQFSEADARLVAAFADQVAIAMENARLYEAERQRAEETEALRATLADITAELELPRLLKAVLERATVLLKATGGDLGLYLEEQDEIVIVVSHNMGKDYAGTRMKPGEGAMGWVALTCEPLVLDDYTSWEKRSPQYLDGPWKAVLAVPMLTGGRTVGAIGLVDSDPSRQFSAWDVRRLTLFAQQAAIAVDNARLYQSAREAAERSAVLHRVSQEVVAASLDPEGIYTAIHRAASKLMTTEAFVIALLDENENKIDGVYLIDREGRTPSMSLPADRGLSGQVISTGASIYIDDLFRELEEGDTIATGSVRFGGPEEVRSILAVPMRLGNKVTGMLSAQSYTVDDYTSEDQHLLEMLASYAAIALENSRLFKEVQRLAITDSLTEIYNRRYFFEQGQREFNRAVRFNRSLSAILVDIDHFKNVNDQYGHAAGDVVLRTVARRIQQAVREIDLVGRYGGEEFTVLLPETDLETARVVAERLHADMKQPFTIPGGRALYLTVSIGVAEMSPSTPNLATLIHEADLAMYTSKRAGRDRVTTRKPTAPAAG